MYRSIVFATAVLLLSAGSALAISGSWTGASDNVWPNFNWGGNGWPGDSSSDTATIANSTNNPVILNSSLANSLSSLTLDSDTPNAAVSFSHTGGNLDVNGTVSVIGGFNGVSTYYAATATFTSTDLAFTPDQMVFSGYPGGTGTAGDAIGVFEADVTLVGAAGVDFTVDGPVDLDLLAGVMVFADAVSLSSDADWLITGNSTLLGGDSVFRMSSFAYASGNRPIEFNGESGGLIVEIGTSP